MVSPGDTIVFSTWIKTSTYAGSGGATLGWDWYNNEGYRIGAIDEFQSDPSRWVDWGEDWTQVTIEKVVPAIVDDPDGVNPSDVPYAIIPWMGASPWSEPTGDYAWFANVELYVNPEGEEPNPTPPQYTPVPTPRIIYSYDPDAPTFATTSIFGMDSSLLFLCVGGIVGVYIVTQTVRGKRYD